MTAAQEYLRLLQQMPVPRSEDEQLARIDDTVTALVARQRERYWEALSGSSPERAESVWHYRQEVDAI